MKANIAGWLIVALFMLFIIVMAVTLISFWSSGDTENEGHSFQLDVDYSNYDSYEIARDMRVSTSSDFSTELYSDGVTVSGSLLNYTFSTAEPADTVYILPALLYVQTAIDKVSVSLEGEMVDGVYVLSSADNDWFNISSVSLERSQDVFYNVAVSFTLNYDTEVPRHVELVTGDTSTGGYSAFYYDENGNFTGGQLVFMLLAASREDAVQQLSSANIEITEVFRAMPASDAVVTSPNGQLEIIILDEPSE